MKNIKIVLLLFILAVAFIAIANLEVETQQGINYKWKAIKIPLGLKALNFLDRHYNYKFLVKNIIRGAKTDEEKALSIFNWTHANLKKDIKGLPIIDDHVWYTIVRGYGASDQFSDVFVTLCNYSGLSAFYGIVYNKNKDSNLSLSFVKINGKWFVFDPYSGVYFKNKANNLADIEDLKLNNYQLVTINSETPDIAYEQYLPNLPEVVNIGFNRANIQSPFRRIIYEVRKWLKLK
jgi:hypothetical protein